MTTAPKRRWFRWSLKGLLLLVTLAALAVYIATVLVVVRDREHLAFPIRAAYTDEGETARPPLVWQLLGAKATSVVSLDPTATERDVAHVKRLFPEARVGVLHEAKPE